MNVMKKAQINKYTRLDNRTPNVNGPIFDVFYNDDMLYTFGLASIIMIPARAVKLRRLPAEPDPAPCVCMYVCIL